MIWSDWWLSRESRHEMEPHDYARMIQGHVARVAIGPSAVRGRGNAGVAVAARDFLRRLDLSPFGSMDEAAFSGCLDEATERLRRSLPRAARHWGLAR